MVAIITGSGLGQERGSAQVLGSRGMLGEAKFGRFGENVTINAATGNLMVNRTDEILVGRGPDSIIARSYNSLGLLNDDNGDNWRLNAQRKVAGLTGVLNSAGSTVTRTDWDGSETVFSWDQATSAYINKSGAGSYDRLTFSSNSWKWTDGDSQTSEVYDNLNGGRIVSTANLVGDKITYGYTADKLTSISTQNGEVSTFAWSGNNVTSVTTVVGAGVTNRVSYTYDSLNRLMEVVTDLTPADGSDSQSVVTSYSYHDTSRRIATINQTGGASLSISYELVGGEHRVKSYTHVWDTGRSTTTTFTYDTVNRVTTIVDESNRVSRMQYDAAGQLIRLELPAGQSGSSTQDFYYSYNSNGDVVSVTDALGNVTTNEYDSKGNLTLQRDQLGNTIARTYGSRNELLTETRYLVADPDGAGAGQPGQPVTTRYAYDEANNLRFEVSAEGRVVEYRYDSKGQNIAVINYKSSLFPNGNYIVGQALSDNAVSSWSLSQGNTSIELTEISYDQRGNVVSEKRYETALLEGAKNLFRSSENLAGAGWGRAGATVTANYALDPDGVMAASRVQLGTGDTMAMQQATLLAGQTYTERMWVKSATGASQSFRLFGADGVANSSDFTATSTWQLFEFTFVAGGTNVFNNGLRSGSSQGSADLLVAKAQLSLGAGVPYVATPNAPYLDATNMFRSSENLAGPGWGKDGATPTVTANYALGPAGAMTATRVQLAAGDSRVYQHASLTVNQPYTERMWVKSNTGINQIFRLYGTDGISSSQDLVATSEWQLFEFSFSPAISVVFANGIRTGTGGTAADLLVASAQLSAGTPAAPYVATGNYSYPAGNGGTFVKSGQTETTFYIYDQSGRLLQRQFSGKTGVETFLYDGLSRIVSATDLSGRQTTSLFIDNSNLEIVSTSNGLVRASTYDYAGNLISYTESGSGISAASERREYDKAGRLRMIVDPDGQKTFYMYDARGNMVADIDKDGTFTEYRYDLSDRLTTTITYATRLSAVELGQLVNSADHVTDMSLLATRPASAQADRWSWRVYDAANRLTQTIDATGAVTAFAYDGESKVVSTTSYATPLSSTAVASLKSNISGGNLFGNPQDISQWGVYNGSTQAAASINGSNAFRITTSNTGQIAGFQKIVPVSAGEAITFALTLKAVGSVTSDAIGILGSASGWGNAQDSVARIVSGPGTLVRGPGGLWQVNGLSASEETRVETTRLFKQAENAHSILYTASSSTLYVNAGDSVIVSAPVVTKSVVEDKNLWVAPQDISQWGVNYGQTAPAGQIGGANAFQITTANTGQIAGFAKAIPVKSGQSLTFSITLKAVGGVTTSSIGLRGGVSGDGSAQDTVAKIVSGPGTLVGGAGWLQGVAGLSASVPTRIEVTRTFRQDETGYLLFYVNSSSALYVQEGDAVIVADPVIYTSTGLAVTLPSASNDDRTSRSFYDKDGRLIGSLASNGSFVKKSYDGLGREIETLAFEKSVSSSLRASGTFSQILSDVSGGALDRRTSYLYDSRGNLRFEIDAAGRVTEYGYDGAGRQVRTTRYAGNIAVAASYTLASVGAQVAALASHIETRVDRQIYAEGDRLTWTINAEGYVTRYVYDSAGRVIRQVQYVTKYIPPSDPSAAAMSAWEASSAHTSDRVTRTFYDVLNRPVYQVDAENYVTRNSYDLRGNLIETRRYGGQYAVGNSTSLSDLIALIGGGNAQRDRVTTSTYDADGRLVGTTDGSGTKLKYIYNAFGEVTDKIVYPTATSGELMATGVDIDWYVATYGAQDSTLTAETAVAHFDQNQSGAQAGWRRNWDPNPLFDTSYYLQQNPDVLSNGINPLQHFLQYGWYEGRAPASGVTVEQYVDRYAATTTHYTYDMLGRLKTETTGYKSEINGVNGANNSVTSYNYTAFGELQTRIDARGNMTVWGYDNAGNRVSETIQLSDGSDALTVNSFNAFGNIVKTVDARLNTSYFYYDRLDRLVLSIDGEGFATGTSYDNNGLSVTTTRYATRPTGTVTVSTMPTLVSDTQDASTKVQYDKLGRVAGITDAMLNSEVYELDAFGNRISKIDKRGSLFTYSYDRLGRLKSEQMPAGGIKTAYQYDSRGNMVEKIEAYEKDEARTTTYEYDFANRLTKKISDPVRVLSADKLNQELREVVESYSYDARGNLTRITDAALQNTYFFYDTRNRKVAEVNAVGTLSTWTYDLNGNVVATRTYPTPVSMTQHAAQTLERAFGSDRPAAPDSLANTEFRETLYAYDKNNRLVSTTVKGVRVGSFDTGTYETSLSGVAFPDVVTTIAYDAMGNVIKQTDARGNIIFSYYDKNGRKIAQVDQENYLTRWAYDAEGNVTRETRFAGKITSITPSESSTLSQLETAAGTGNPADRVTEFEYDKNGRRVVERRLGVSYYTINGTTMAASAGLPASAVIGYAYNENGQVVSKTEANGDVFTYVYDANGRLEQATNPSFAAAISGTLAAVTGRIITTYTYDGLNNVLSIKTTGVNDANPSVSILQRYANYSYSEGGRLEYFTESRQVAYESVAEVTRHYAYDIMGNIVRERFNRTIGVDSVTPDAILREFDAMGRITYEANVTLTNGAWVGQIANHTAYNAFGEVSKKGINAVWQEFYDYNRRGQLRKTNSEDGSWQMFVYDANGNVSLKMTSYGGSDSAIAVADLTNMSVEAALAILTVNAAGQTKKVGEAGVRGITPTIYGYDKRNQLITIREPSRETGFNASGNAIGSRIVADLTSSKTYNAFGEVASETDAEGRLTSYKYNTMGRLVQKDLPSVAYIKEDNSSATAILNEQYYYDLAGRLIGTQDARGKVNTRLLLAGTGFGGDEAKVTVEGYADGGRVTTTYDVLGRAIARTTLLDTVGGASTYVRDLYSYDLADNLLSVQHGGLSTGTTWTDAQYTDYYGYDQLGRRIVHSNSVFLANPATGAPAPSETTKYDLDGRVIATSDFEGRQTTYTYSWNGAAQTGNLGTYGAWTKTTDSGIKRVDNSAVTSWESVDYYGHSLQRSDFGGKVTTTAYNRAGYLVQEYGSTYDVTDYSYLNTGRYLLISSKLILEEKDWVGALGSPSGYLQVNQKRRQIDTQFKYDKVGNRTFERAVITYFGEGNGFVADKEIRADRQIAFPTAGGPAWTSDLTFIDRAANISYDSWNRIETYTDTGLVNAVSNTYDQLAMTSYQYDANSNVKSVSATYKNLAIGASGTLTTEYWHSYDDMNRFLVNGGVKSGSTILIAANQGGSFTYNKAGWRISSTKGAGTALQLEQYDYDALGNISAIKLKTGTFAVPPVLRGSYGRDALGRVTSYTEFGSGGLTVYSRYDIQYDMTNQIRSELTYQQSGSTYETLNTVYDYSLNANGTLFQNGLRQTYVAGQYQGVLTHIITRKGGVVGEGANATETEYFYNWGEQALRYHAGILTGAGTGPGSALTVNYDDLEYDSRGNLTGVEFDISNASARYRSDFINTFDGKVMARYTSKNESVAPSNLALEYSYYANDRLVGMNGNDGAPEKDYSTAIQTRYAAPSTTAFRTGYSAYADFNQSYEPVNLNSDRGASTAYAVQDGDSLAGIALAIWGDASLWYLLADANGMSADSSLAVGSTLWVPAGVHNVHNSSTTFKPYDPNLAHSNTEPIVAAPQAGKKKKKCGALGQILVMAVSVAVTAILTPVLGPWAPVAGNIAGQGVGLATGVQSKFNFKSLAMTAITAGINQSGITNVGSIAGSNALGDIASGVASSTLSQGVAIAAGLQSRFSWTNVAAAGVQAGVGGAVRRSLPGSGGAVDQGLGKWVVDGTKQSVANNTLSGVAGSLAAAAATSLVTGSNFGDTIIAQLPSILGNTIGNLAAEVASIGSPKPDGGYKGLPGFHDAGDGIYIRDGIASPSNTFSLTSDSSGFGLSTSERALDIRTGITDFVGGIIGSVEDFFTGGGYIRTALADYNAQSFSGSALGRGIGGGIRQLGANSRISFGFLPETQNGYYDPISDSITLNRSIMGNRIETMLTLAHEGLHRYLNISAQNQNIAYLPSIDEEVAAVYMTSQIYSQTRGRLGVSAYYQGYLDILKAPNGITGLILNREDAYANQPEYKNPDGTVRSRSINNVLYKNFPMLGR